MKSSVLGDALFTKTQQKVLALLYGNPERSFYTNEIVRIANVGIGSIKRELDKMTDSGLLTLQSKGNQKHYQANKACPIFSELHGIVIKTFGIVDVLRVALEPIMANVIYAFVYGSVAKGTEKSKSDIDLMLIGSELSYTEIMELLIPAEDQLGRTINPTVYSLEDLRKKIDQENSFVTRVMEQPKIIVKGSEDDIK